MQEWTKERGERVQKDIMFKIYYEFVYKQRDHKLWQAGMDVIAKIGGR